MIYRLMLAIVVVALGSVSFADDAVNTASVEALVRQLSAPEFRARENAVRAIEQLGDPALPATGPFTWTSYSKMSALGVPEASTPPTM